VAWEVIYYQTDDGECPVRTFLDELPKPHRAKVFAAISLLQERVARAGVPPYEPGGGQDSGAPLPLWSPTLPDLVLYGQPAAGRTVGGI